MLRARAWLQDYCSKSAKVTPEMAKKYQSELEHMTASQLHLWLLKFDHEEEQHQQQYTFWQQAHSQNLTRAMAANQAARQSYAAINQEQSEAAGVAEQQINEQQQFTESEQLNKQMQMSGPYGYGYYPGYGGVHFHYHLIPVGALLRSVGLLYLAFALLITRRQAACSRPSQTTRRAGAQLVPSSLGRWRHQGP